MGPRRDLPAPLLDAPVRWLPLFVYGTLTDEAFLSALLGRSVPAEPARLPGHAAVTLARFAYPVVVPSPDASVTGKLYRGLTADDYARLDAYEGVGEGLYRRVTVEAVTARGATEAWLYAPTSRTLERFGP